MDLQLIIRAPNQNIKDQVIDCQGDWTVLQLKDHLFNVYPSKPVVREQKLIYSGHLLSDALLLKDVIRSDSSDSNVHILHLVYNGSGNWPTSSKQKSQPCQNVGKQTVTAEASSRLSTTNSEIPLESTLRNRTQPIASLPYNYQYLFAPVSPFGYTPEQNAEMERNYQQFIGQYIQGMSALTGNPDMFRALNNYQTYVNATPNPEVRVPTTEPQINQRANVIAQMEPPEHYQQDWVDKFYQYSRYFLLLSILFCYSTPERLMLVIIGVVIAILYREGWFMRQTIEDAVRRRNNIQVEANVAAGDNINDQAQPQENAPQDGQELEAAMDGDHPPHAPDAPNNNQGFSAFSIIAAFFFSLVPDPPPPMNLN